jgi:LuxR family transcriptional regulator, maltose regulon positive regulatory protein
MQSSLLTTKLYFPPARPALVPRSRLVERLEKGLSGPLTLISAPAGYGKTTLMSEWRAGAGSRMPVAWVSLDITDNDLTRFLLYLTASLDTVQPGIAQEIQPLLQISEKPNTEAILTLLVNALNGFPQHFAVVLDDFHVIETPAIYEAMTFLLEHLPSHMHLVLLTRADPTLPLARLRTRGQLTEIRADHLSFSEDEAAEFLNRIMGLGLTGEQVDALDKRTEGWVAGLQLAALSLQGREDVQGFISAFTGSNHYIVDYLAEEVIGRQPESLREFLLKTSILERLTGPLCDAVWGAANGREILEKLEHDNLFIIPLDGNRQWYRYHNLFIDLLRSRLLHFQPEIVPGLHTKASEWFEKKGYLDEAIHHALESKDFERAARLFCQDQLQVIYSRSIAQLDLWLKDFPDTFILSDPRLCIAKAHILWSTGRRAEIEPFIISAQKTLSERIAASQWSEKDPDIRIMQGETYTFQSLFGLQKGEYDSAAQLSQKALEILPETTRHRVFTLGSLYRIYKTVGDIELARKFSSQAVAAARQLNYPSMHSTAVYSLAEMLRVQGKLNQSIQVLQESLDYIKSQGQERLFYNGYVHIALAETFYELNALDEMESELEIGLGLCRQGGMSVLVTTGLLDQALLSHARGNVPVALKLLAGIEQKCKDMDPVTYRDTCIGLRLRWQAELGNLTGLVENVNLIDLNVENKIGTRRFPELFQAALFLSDLGRNEEALLVLGKMDTNLREAGYTGWLISVLALQSVVWKKINKESRALDSLRQALVLAEPEGYVRTFLDHGDLMRELLHSLQKRGTTPKYVSHLLAVFVGQPPGKKVATSGRAANILSSREIELLNLVASGCSNKEVAGQLFISLATVKRHTVNIFNKLDVKNRTEAVARARELGLL